MSNVFSRSTLDTTAGGEAPLIVQVLHHRDDIAIAKRAASLGAEEQALFPILVAIARMVAQVDSIGVDSAPGAHEPD